MLYDLYIYRKTLLLCLTLVFMLAGCSTTNISSEQMLAETNGFNLPHSPLPNKALVYCIYRADTPKVYGDRIGLYYANSTAERFENSNDMGSTMLDIFTLGLTKELPLAEKIFIGELEPGQFKTIQLDPGFYEFKRILVRPSTIIKRNEGIKQVKLESGNIYFMEISGRSFYNRYSKMNVHNIYITEERDSLVGKYILFKNFNEVK